MFLFIFSNIIFLFAFGKVLPNTIITNEEIKHDTTDECSCQYECTNVTKDMNSVMNCLKKCGFSIIPNLYNATILTEIYIKFFHNFSKEERYEYLDRNCKQNGECLSGRRYEHAIPHFNSIHGFNNIIYQPLIAESALNFMKREMIQNKNIYNFETDPIILDTMTFITAPRSRTDINQEFHRDGQFGLKLQVPLINVTNNRGPIEILALEGLPISDDERIVDKNCRVKGTVALGTAILYQQNVFHRGTKNNHPHIRPVIDTSFLTLSEHLDQNYFKTFTQTAKNAMAKNQEIFYEYCEKAINCPGTKKTYTQKEDKNTAHKMELFEHISAKAQAKAKFKAKYKARARARARARSLKFDL
eukprot:260980_1